MPETTTPNRETELAAQFEEALRGFVEGVASPPVPNLTDAMAYALATDISDPALRGKRIRPVLCLLTAEALGADAEIAQPFALAIELMHNFCLVHDDIEDGDVMRRGRASVWKRYGIPHAINVGDFLLVQSQRALLDWGTPRLTSDVRFRLLALLGRALDRTHVGQAMDINARATHSITADQYLEIVREKTGHYLAAPIQGGAMVAGAGSEVLEKIGQMADFLGPMFQIMDDIIDLTEGKGRESTGSDIREGKRSFLVAYAAARCSSAERDQLFAILDRPRDETSPSDISSVMDLFERCGSIDAGRAICRDLFQKSQPILASLPPRLAQTLETVFEALSNRRR